MSRCVAVFNGDEPFCCGLCYGDYGDDSIQYDDDFATERALSLTYSIDYGKDMNSEEGL